MFIWSVLDLEQKLSDFKSFYNENRAHSSLDGGTPLQKVQRVATLDCYQWKQHCRGLYQTPIAA